MTDNAAEAIAKSAVIDFVRRSRRTPSVKIISELPLPQFGVRADLVVCGRTPTAIEIKTARDSLVRLERQSRALCHAFPNVYFAISPNHLPKILLQSPDGVGILVVEAGTARLVRKPAVSATYSSAIAVEIIPTRLLAKWLECPARTTRSDLVAIIRNRSEADQRKAIRWFLNERWSLSSSPQETKRPSSGTVPGNEKPSRVEEYYGRDFGTVPEHLRLRLKT
jgi:hypothetical protein